VAERGRAGEGKIFTDLVCSGADRRCDFHVVVASFIHSVDARSREEEQSHHHDANDQCRSAAVIHASAPLFAAINGIKRSGFPQPTRRCPLAWRGGVFTTSGRLQQVYFGGIVLVGAAVDHVEDDRIVPGRTDPSPCHRLETQSSCERLKIMRSGRTKARVMKSPPATLRPLDTGGHRSAALRDAIADGAAHCGNGGLRFRSEAKATMLSKRSCSCVERLDL
jgi:hypothetical protein